MNLPLLKFAGKFQTTTFTKFVDVSEFLNTPIHATAPHGHHFSPQTLLLRPRISVTSEQLR